MNDACDERKRKWFFWGIALMGTVSIPLMIGLFSFFRGISGEKATGVAAIAGGLAESYAILGIALGLALPVGAIYFLARSFSGGHRMRALLAVLSIGWSTLTLALAGLVVWLSFVYLPHRAR